MRAGGFNVVGSRPLQAGGVDVAGWVLSVGGCGSVCGDGRFDAIQWAVSTPSWIGHFGPGLVTDVGNSGNIVASRCNRWITDPEREGPTMTPGPWRKSTRSQGSGGNCVEARLNQTGPEVRDSKLGDASPILSLSRTDFTALLDSVK